MVPGVEGYPQQRLLPVNHSSKERTMITYEDIKDEPPQYYPEEEIPYIISTELKPRVSVREQMFEELKKIQEGPHSVRGIK